MRHSKSPRSEESVLGMERKVSSQTSLNSSLQPFPSAGQHPESNSAYFSWPTSTQLHGAVEGRANYFGNLQKGVLPGNPDHLPISNQAITMLDLMTIRAFHSKILRRCSLGTAIGFRIRKGTVTAIPAILVFVARKVHRKWLSHNQCLPTVLEGPGGIWCDVDVLEFSYYGAPAQTPKEQLYSELVDGLRGSDPCIGSGSQVASQETYGTLGAIVKSRTGNGQVGFLTNRHVAVDLDYPNQKMFHPLPPNLGPGIYLGAVERATSFSTDDLWYGTYAGMNPGTTEKGVTYSHYIKKVTDDLSNHGGDHDKLISVSKTFVRADGAFIPFTHDFDMTNVTTLVKGVGEIGDPKIIDLQSPINHLIGKQVVKVGRSSGLTTGTVIAYALEYNDEKGNCFFTDFLVVGENQQTFDLEGDSGSLILLCGEDGEKPRPIGIIWGGTANRGKLKLRVGQPPENWTSGVDLGRLLDLLELDVITTAAGLQEAVTRQRRSHSPMVEETSPTVGTLLEEQNEAMYEPLGFNIQQLPADVSSGSRLNLEEETKDEFHVDADVENVEEHQFIPSFVGMPPINLNQEDDSHGSRNLSALRNSADEDLSVSLQLGDREPKRQRSEPALRIGSPK